MVAGSGRRQRDSDRAIRPRMGSEGRPGVNQRGVQREFWTLIAQGMGSEAAAVAVGVSTPVGSRWSRDGGGMPPISLAAPTGRYLSFAEREEIAIYRAQSYGVRQIARRVVDAERILTPRCPRTHPGTGGSDFIRRRRPHPRLPGGGRVRTWRSGCWPYRMRRILVESASRPAGLHCATRWIATLLGDDSCGGFHAARIRM